MGSLLQANTGNTVPCFIDKDMATESISKIENSRLQVYQV